MKRKGIEQKLVILLFVMVIVVFSLAERDSRRLDRLYKTAQLLHKKVPNQMVHASAGPVYLPNK